jgi:hypothetical protein
MQIIVEIINFHGSGNLYDSLWEARNELLFLPPNHGTETFLVELIISYCKYKKTLKNVVYLLRK